MLALDDGGGKSAVVNWRRPSAGSQRSRSWIWRAGPTALSSRWLALWARRYQRL